MITFGSKINFLINQTIQLSNDAIFQLLVSKRARVPLGDGFLARRIAGPGLAGAYFYQIRTEQALFALETKMELDQLRAYKVCEFGNPEALNNDSQALN